jgi:hypothetical protein
LVLIKTDTRYVIKFVCGGVFQYADFRESQGELVRPVLRPSWIDAKLVPDVSDMKTIDQVLEAIRTFSPRAEIYLINGAPVFFQKKKRAKRLISSMGDAHDEFIRTNLTKFFTQELLPIIKSSGWKITRSDVGYYVLVKKVDGDWDNVSSYESFEFEFMCAKALQALDVIENVSIRNEHQNYLWESKTLFCRVNDIETCGVYINY